MFSFGQFGDRGIQMPVLGARITIPDVFIDSKRGREMHNSVSRWASTNTLNWHHRMLMRDHFKQTNRHKYRHYPRQKGYKAKKKRRFGSITDLVKTRKSKSAFLSVQPRVSFKQQTPTGIVHAYMRYKWPFPVSRRVKHPKAVTAQKMNAEVTRWTPDEIQRASQKYAVFWAERYRHTVRNSKKYRKLILPKL